MYPKNTLPIIVLFFVGIFFSQCSQKQGNDTLSNGAKSAQSNKESSLEPTEEKDLQTKTDSELYKLITSTTDTVKQEEYIAMYLKSAKKKEKISSIAMSYHFLMNNRYNKEGVLIYADSLIELASPNNFNYYLAAAYQAKADYYFVKKAHSKALENYLQVSMYAKKMNQGYVLFRANHNIAVIKTLIGDYEEALLIAKENLEYPRKNQKNISQQEYLSPLTVVAYIYNDLKKIDSASYYNSFGIQEALRMKDTLYYHNFALNQALTHYHNANFEVAIDSFQKHIPKFLQLEQLNQKVTQRPSIYLFYFGKSYFELNQKEEGIKYFKKVDSIFMQDKTLFPTITDTYGYLIDYYKERNDANAQVLYLNRLMEVQDIVHSQEVYLNRKIFTEYDIPKLKAKNKEIAEKGTQLRKTILILSGLVFILVVAFGIQYRKRQIYKKRFQEILHKSEVPKEKKKKAIAKNDSKTINVPDHIIEEILKGLDYFEKNHEFTSNKTTLAFLSKKLGTNPNYLSKVINHYKGTSFTKYLNNLRIDYTVQQLKENATYRKYTIKAIAYEVGFNNVQSFAKAFYNSKGINPSFFMKELKKVS